MWKKELNFSAPVSIMSSNGWHLQGDGFQNFLTIRTVGKQNELPYLVANSVKIATIYNADATEFTLLDT